MSTLRATRSGLGIFAVVIAIAASLCGTPAWADETTQVRVLLTKFDDGDARDAKLRSSTTPGKYDEHQDDAYVLLREGTTPVLRRSPAQPIQIVVDPGQVHQTMLGHGAAMTDASAYVLMNLKAKNPSLFAYVMKRLFEPKAGAGFSFLRLPMGASDYTATKTYSTYCDEESPDLRKFSTAHDAEYIIPALKEALKLNPEIRILGSPWSPPAWMKTNKALKGISQKDKAVGKTCRLKPECFDIYAEYFVKFIEAYKAAGIELYSVTPQNEPQFDAADYPCMRMDEDDQIKFVKLLGGKLEAKGLKTRIFVHDHNWALHPDDRKAVGGDEKMDPVASVTKILSDREAARYVAGTAWHCYHGDAALMKRTYETVHERFPEKQILCTEASGWGKNRGAWFGDVEWGLSHNWLGGPQHWCEAALQWNLVLDQKFGPTLRGDSQATALVSVNTDRYDEARFEREFYALAQMSRAARPGSKRIAAAVQAGNGTGLELIGFQLPNGQTSLVVFNKNDAEKAFEVESNRRFFAYHVPARSIATFVW
jgi:glucosylceramidase